MDRNQNENHRHFLPEEMKTVEVEPRDSEDCGQTNYSQGAEMDCNQGTSPDPELGNLLTCAWMDYRIGSDQELLCASHSFPF